MSFWKQPFPLDYVSWIKKYCRSYKITYARTVTLYSCKGLLSKLEDFVGELGKLVDKDIMDYIPVFMRLVCFHKYNLVNMKELAVMLHTLRAELWCRFIQDKYALAALLGTMMTDADCRNIVKECLDRIIPRGKVYLYIDNLWRFYESITKDIDAKRKILNRLAKSFTGNIDELPLCNATLPYKCIKEVVDDLLQIRQWLVICYFDNDLADYKKLANVICELKPLYNNDILTDLYETVLSFFDNNSTLRFAMMRS